MVRNGSVRTYRVEGEGGVVQELRVDIAGRMIVAARLGFDASTPFTCEGDRCVGIRVGPYDQQGARPIVFDNARLSRMARGADGADEEVAVVTARLRTIPDDELPATACAGQILYISIGDGTAHFCPDSGTGFDIDPDGGRTYRFTNSDGDSIGVAVDKVGKLRRVEYGEFVCTAPACTGADISPAGAGGRRNFAFRGTTLVERDTADSSVILNGNVVLAPQ
jgi:hypothetical protein